MIVTQYTVKKDSIKYLREQKVKIKPTITEDFRVAGGLVTIWGGLDSLKYLQISISNNLKNHNEILNTVQNILKESL